MLPAYKARLLLRPLNLTVATFEVISIAFFYIITQLEFLVSICLSRHLLSNLKSVTGERLNIFLDKTKGGFSNVANNLKR